MANYDDPRILRAIAHPTRNRVLHELSAAGSLRAADIARRLEIPANQASFHLRQLAKYGLVEEDPGAARDKRDRVWRLSTPDGISFNPDEMVAQPGGKAAYAVFQRSAVERGRHLVERAFAREGSSKKSVSESSVRLSEAEVKKLTQELLEVVNRYRDAGMSGGVGEDDGRATYSVLQLVQPIPDDPPRGGDA